MKTENSTGPLPGLTAQWRKLLLAVIGMIALSVMSCRSPGRMTASSRLSDSLQSVRQSVLTLLPVPASVAQTKLSMSQLAALPEGAGYSARSGQATATVLRGQGDTLIITSTCDSLAREVIALREELIRIRNETGETVEEPPPQVVQEPTGFQWFQIWIGRIAVAVLLLILIKRRLKRN